jgi:hypothetical protein
MEVWRQSPFSLGHGGPFVGIRQRHRDGIRSLGSMMIVVVAAAFIVGGLVGLMFRPYTLVPASLLAAIAAAP